MIQARGLTLLETVAAAALLAVLGAAGASLLVDARQRVDRPEPSVTIHDLSRLADALSEDPESLGVSGSATEWDGTALQWPASFEMDGAPQVTLRLVESEGFPPKETAEDKEPTRHAWLVLECGEVATGRWIELPDAEATP